MKILYNNKNEEKEMKVLMRFETVHNGKRMNLLLVLTLPTELSILTTNSFQSHTCVLNIPPIHFGYNVYKKANINIVIRFVQLMGLGTYLIVDLFDIYASIPVF